MSDTRAKLREISNFINREDKSQIVLFRCKDWTTEIVGRIDDEGNHYVERGDGTRYQYHRSIVEWTVPLSREKGCTL